MKREALLDRSILKLYESATGDTTATDDSYRDDEDRAEIVSDMRAVLLAPTDEKACEAIAWWGTFDESGPHSLVNVVRRIRRSALRGKVLAEAKA